MTSNWQRTTILFTIGITWFCILGMVAQPTAGYPRSRTLTNDLIKRLVDLEKSLDASQNKLYNTSPSFQRNAVFEPIKRTLDFGTSRGESAIQAAKQAYGLNAAMSAFGPGK